MTSGIYIATNKVNGRRYIGYSANIEARWEEYNKILDRGPSRKHPLIHKDLQENGMDAFCFGILEVLDTQEPALLHRRAEYWRNLFQPEYNQTGGNTERQIVTQELAILAPVPVMHLTSGIKVCLDQGKVAFGCSGKDFFDKVDNLREGAEVEVFIYASLTQQSIGAKVSWRALYVGYVDAVEGRHPEGERFRPHTTSNDGDWNAFWEVRDLRPLASPVEISTFRGYGNRNGATYNPSFIPRGPLLIEYPALL